MVLEELIPDAYPEIFHLQERPDHQWIADQLPTLIDCLLSTPRDKRLSIQKEPHLSLARRMFPGPTLLDVAEMMSEIVVYQDRRLQDVLRRIFRILGEMIAAMHLLMPTISHVVELRRFIHRQQDLVVIGRRIEIAIRDPTDRPSNHYKQGQDR